MERDRNHFGLGVSLALLAAIALAFAVAGDSPVPAKLTAEQEARLKERDRLADEAYKLRAAGKLPEATAAAEKILAIERDIFGNFHQELIGTLTFLAEVHQQREDIAATRKARQEVVAIQSKLHGEKHWRVTDARLELAQLDLMEKLDKGQRQTLAEADQFNRQVVQLHQQGKMAEAVEAARQALALRKKVLGDNHPDTALSLNNLGFLLRAQGDSTAARPYYEQTLEIYKKVLGDTHPNTALSLNNLGSLLQSQGDYPAARRHYEQALDIYKKAQGENHPNTARTLNNLGSLLQMQNESAAARPYLEQALAIYKKIQGDNHPDTARALNNLGYLLHSQGDYAAARPYYAQALAIKKKVSGDEHPDTALALNNLAFLLQDQGDYATARPYFERALAIRRKVWGDNHTDTALSLNNLGGLLQAQGDYAAARPYYVQALAIYRKLLGDNHPETARVLNNLGLLLRTQGDHVAARPYYEQALAIKKKVRGENHPDTAMSLNNLGFLLQAQGDHAAARPYYEQSLAIYKKVRGENHPDTALALNNMGGLLQAQGDQAAARTHYQQALDIYKKRLGDDHPDTARALNNLGVLLQGQGDYAAARPYFEQALAINKKSVGEYHPDTARALNNLALLLRAQGDDRAARAHFEQALAITRRSLDLAAAAQSERQQLAMAQNLRQLLDSYLSLSSRLPGAPAYRDVLAWKGAVLVRQRQLRLERTDPKLAPQVAELRNISCRLATLAFATPSPKQREASARQIAELSERKEELESELARQSNLFRSSQAATRLTPEQLQKVLPAGSVLVDFLEYSHTVADKEKGKVKRQRRLAAFVVRPDQEVVQVDLGPVSPIATAIEQWRKTFGAVGAEHDPAAELRRRVWEPLLPHLKDAKLVLVSPDGALARFPLAALPGKEAGTYLLEELALAVVPVPQLLPELMAPALPAQGGDKGAVKEPTLLVVGDVNFDTAVEEASADAAGRSAPRGHRTDALLQWRSLAGTRAEVVAIKDSFQRRYRKGMVTELREEEPTEDTVRQQASRHQYVHFATHGFFAPAELRSALLAVAKTDGTREGDLVARQDIAGFHPGLLSGLVLAGANKPLATDKDDGILTALEVAELDLSGIELATLSACETGLGEAAGGEGVLGLQRAFQVAGARSVVASLWKVHDDATRSLMVDFYENLWRKKMSRVEALRMAQLSMLREGVKRGLEMLDEQKPDKTRRLPPYYWAAFVLSGDWR